MKMQLLRLRAFAFMVCVASLAFTGLASADPPSRVARLGYMSGAVSFSPAGENDWLRARINRPLTAGDRLWTDARARAEIQVGGAAIRMNARTSVSILNLDDRIVQLQLTQGTLNVRVRRLERDQVFEVNTPNLAFSLRRPGEYRIEVDPDGNSTEIFVRRGEGEAYGEGAAYVIDSRQPYRFSGTGLRDYEYVDFPRLDEFDRWAGDRDRRYDNSGSARYVSQDVVGYEDLDANGTWRSDATYGNIWFPNRMATGWAPYRDGHWAWIDPWGWTWMDDAPWGYAVSHYGRWTNLRGSWGWVPGPVRSRAYYAPALVAFVGGNNFRLSISSGNVGGVAWFPLGPREVYRPSYATSRGYFENVNHSNTIINTTVINNYYNNSNVTNIVYANRQVPGAVIAVPTAAFVQSQQVSRAAVHVSREMNVGGPVAFVPRVAPTERSVRGNADQGERPPDRVFERPVVARTAPPAVPAGFAAQQQQLSARPGAPLDEAARRQLRPLAAAPAPVVKVVAPSQVAPPTALPPRIAPADRGDDERASIGDRKVPAMPGAASAPSAGQQVAPPAPAGQQEQRGRFEQRGRSEQRAEPIAPPPAPPQRAEPVAPPPAPPQRAAPAQLAPQVAPPAPAAQQEQRGRFEQRGRSEQRAEPIAPPPAPPQRAAPPAQLAPQVAPPAPAAQQEQRGRFEQRGRSEQRAEPVAPPPAPPPASPQRAAPAPVAPQAAPAAPPAAQDPKPAESRPDGKKKDKDEKKRDREDRTQRD